jgi:outer membrane protein assembly factor BamB
LTCRAADTGRPRWERALPFVPVWVGGYTDRVVACGAGGVACLRLEDGADVWVFRVPEEPLAAFQVAGGRLFFLKGGRRLFAVDVETGSALWSRQAPGAGFDLPYPEGRFFPDYHAGTGTVLVQTSGRRLVLDSATGRRIQDSPTSRTPWPRPPLMLDGRTACLVPDSRHVILCDTATGRDVWT